MYEVISFSFMNVLMRRRIAPAESKTFPFAALF